MFVGVVFRVCVYMLCLCVVCSVSVVYSLVFICYICSSVCIVYCLVCECSV